MPAIQWPTDCWPIRLHLVKDYALSTNSLLILQFLLRP